LNKPNPALSSPVVAGRAADPETERGLTMQGWASFENHWTGARVHVRPDNVAAVSQTGPNAVEIHTTGGGLVTVKGTADTVFAAIEAAGKKPGRKDMETR
jgi:hypothetical protein